MKIAKLLLAFTFITNIACSNSEKIVVLADEAVSQPTMAAATLYDKNKDHKLMLGLYSDKNEHDLCMRKAHVIITHEGVNLQLCQNSKVKLRQVDYVHDVLILVINPNNDWAVNLTNSQYSTLSKNPKLWKDVNDLWPSRAITIYPLGDDKVTMFKVASEKYSLGFIRFSSNYRDFMLKELSIDGIFPDAINIYFDRYNGPKVKYRIFVNTSSKQANDFFDFLKANVEIFENHNFISSMR